MMEDINQIKVILVEKKKQENGSQSN